MASLKRFISKLLQPKLWWFFMMPEIDFRSEAEIEAARKRDFEYRYGDCKKQTHWTDIDQIIRESKK